MTDKQRMSMYKKLTDKFSEAMIFELDANHKKKKKVSPWY